MGEKRVTSRFVLRGDNQLNSAFNKAQQQLAQLGRQAALFGAVAVAAGVAMVRSQAKQIDALAKTADALGITTENLQALRAMAELTGVEVGKFDKALARMQKTIGEVARRGGDMALAITDMGLSVEDVMALPADQQFEVIARALGRIENASVQASIANDLFGRDAQKMLKLTAQLAREGLGPMRDELAAIGALVSRTEAAGVERMNDSMLIASRVADGLAQKFTVTLAPSIAAIAEEFTEAAKKGDGFGDDAAGAADSVSRKIFFLLDLIDLVGREFNIAANLGIIAFEGLKFSVVDLADNIINGPNRAVNLLLQQLDRLPGVDIDFRFGDLTGLRADAEQSTAIIAAAMEEIDALLLAPLPSAALKERLAKINAELAAAGPERPADSGSIAIIPPEEEQRIAKIQGALAGLMNQVREFGASDDERALLKLIDLGASEDQIAQARLIMDELRFLRAGEEAQKASDQERNARAEEYARIVESLRTAQEVHNADIERLGELYAAGVIPSAEEYAEIVNRINERFLQSQEKSKEAGDQMTEFAVQAARNVQTQFADFLFDPFDDGLSGMLKGFGDTLRRMAAEAASQAILSALFGGLAGSSNPFLSALGGAFGGARAEGGPISAGVPYLVGERGPELVVPRASGMVLPNRSMGNQVTVNIDARESDNPGRLLALVPVIQSQIEQSIALKQRRGYA